MSQVLPPASPGCSPRWTTGRFRTCLRLVLLALLVWLAVIWIPHAYQWLGQQVSALAALPARLSALLAEVAVRALAPALDEAQSRLASDPQVIARVGRPVVLGQLNETVQRESDAERIVFEILVRGDVGKATARLTVSVAEPQPRLVRLELLSPGDAEPPLEVIEEAPAEAVDPADEHASGSVLLSRPDADTAHGAPRKASDEPAVEREAASGSGAGSP